MGLSDSGKNWQNTSQGWQSGAWQTRALERNPCSAHAEAGRAPQSPPDRWRAAGSGSQISNGVPPRPSLPRDATRCGVVRSLLLSTCFARALPAPWLLVSLCWLQRPQYPQPSTPVCAVLFWGRTPCVLLERNADPKVTTVRDPRPIVISGPSGVGKGTLYKLLFQVHTSRAPRPPSQPHNSPSTIRDP